MKLLASISDETLGLPLEEAEASATPQNREAARAVIFNDKQQIALLYSERDKYHKLPGGGIDEGEDWKLAVVREAIEEVGCSIKLRPVELGIVEETRNKHQLEQKSYCCVADVDGEIKNTQLTDMEIADQIGKPLWVSVDEALNLLKNDKPTYYIGHFIVQRDIIFLTEAKKVLGV